ncbi:MAG: hypothetical protein K2X71_22290, partial [Methylobacterium sp.]|nr:hypothetical protein [Methylobacterium sp.]
PRSPRAQITAPPDRRRHLKSCIAPDRRDYHVDFAKAERSFGFAAGLTIGEAVVEIAAAIRAKRLSDTPACHTVRWYRDLLSRPGHGLRLPDALPAETFLPAAATA